jgi:RNA polymerase sigma-70 factor (ECF subfamily)
MAVLTSRKDEMLRLGATERASALPQLKNSGVNVIVHRDRPQSSVHLAAPNGKRPPDEVNVPPVQVLDLDAPHCRAKSERHRQTSILPLRVRIGCVVQETYVRAIRGAENLRAGSNVKSWLFTILRNIRLNQLRQQRTAPKFIELDADEGKTDIAIETSPDTYAHYVGKTELKRVREAIQQLSSDLREIILLREFEELTYREIANLLGCPIGTVMSRLARARSKLRTLVSISDATQS